MGKLIKLYQTVSVAIGSHSGFVWHVYIISYRQLLYEFNRVIEIDDTKDIMNKNCKMTRDNLLGSSGDGDIISFEQEQQVLSITRKNVYHSCKRFLEHISGCIFWCKGVLPKRIL